MEVLAIDGGKPVRADFLPYGHQLIDETDIQAVVEVLRSAWLTTGPQVKAYESAFAERVGAEYAIAVNSGTAALHTAAYAAGIGSGDEVLVSPMTFAASANCVVYQGAKPVFVDVLPDTLNIDPLAVERAITSKTKAIIAVDYTGQPCNYAALQTIAKRHHLIVIEDAAHALGATYRDKPVGALNALTAFSTHPVKLITTGEGGVVTTNNLELAEKMRYFRNHGITTDHRQRQEQGGWLYEMVDLGYNYRLPDILCALGLSQLTKLDGWLARRREIAAQYAAAFADMPEVQPLTVIPEAESAWHLYMIQIDVGQLCVDRAQIFRALRAENIGVNVHYIPVHYHPFYQQRFGYGPGLCPVAESAYERLLTLPISPGMQTEDVGDVITAVQKVIGEYRR